jgi:PiT family inorganic phosphate transporter
VTPNLLLLIITVLVALAFDFLNGFHDAANSIATVVSTRVLSPKLAVVWAAFFNFVAAFFLGTAVAKTIGKGMVRIDSVTQYVVIAGLLGAIVWDLLTWWWALPTSSSHALIGGYAGAAIMRSGFHVIIVEGWYKTLIFIVVAPIMGLVLGFSFMVAIFWMLRDKPPQRIDGWFRKLQLLSAAGYSLGHGGNDAQKTMGIITLGLVSAGILPTFHVPVWVIAVSAIAMAAGTLAGGRRIIHTMGTRLAHLEPIHGFAAETSAGAVIQVASHLGFPLSTTHVISSSILGVGAARRMNAVRWEVVKGMVSAWMLTIPVTATLGFAAAFLAQKVFR